MSSRPEPSSGLTRKEADKNAYGCWEYAIACLRERLVQGRDIPPAELAEIVGTQE